MDSEAEATCPDAAEEGGPRVAGETASSVPEAAAANSVPEAAAVTSVPEAVREEGSIEEDSGGLFRS